MQAFQNRIFLLVFSFFLLGSGVCASADDLPPDQDWVIVRGVLTRFLMLPVDPFAIAVRSLMAQQDHAFERRAKVGHRTDGCSLWSGDFEKKDQCSCEQVCPLSYSLLSVRLGQVTPEHDNFLSFLNEIEDFDDIAPRTVGYCWGQSTVLRDFHYLAFWDRDNKTNQKIPSIEDKTAWKKFYSEKIKKVLHKEATVIPGFSSLREFSSDSTINKELRKQTVETWRKIAIRWESLPMLLRSYSKNQISLERIDQIVSYIKHRISLNQTPKIWFSDLHDAKSIHVVPVYSVIETDRGTKLCFIDNHAFEREHLNCGRHLLIKLDGTVYYSEWDWERDLHPNVKWIGITPEDVLENVLYTRGISKICRKVTACRL